MQAHAVAERVGQLTIARVVLQAHIVANLQFSRDTATTKKKKKKKRTSGEWFSYGYGGDSSPECDAKCNWNCHLRHISMCQLGTPQSQKQG